MSFTHRRSRTRVWGDTHRGQRLVLLTVGILLGALVGGWVQDRAEAAPVPNRICTNDPEVCPPPSSWPTTRSQAQSQISNLRWGQTRGGGPFSYLTHQQSHRFNRLYADAVVRWETTHRGSLAYPTARGFRAHTGCVVLRFPSPVPRWKLCRGTWTGQDESFGKMIEDTHRIGLGCAGEVVGGAVAGGVIGFWTGPGFLVPAALGGAGAGLACEATNAFDTLLGL